MILDFKDLSSFATGATMNDQPADQPTTLADRADLLPCPFCGGKPEFVDHSVEYPERGFVKKYVTCSSGCDASSGLHETYGEALDAWNTRSASTATDATLADRAREFVKSPHTVRMTPAAILVEFASAAVKDERLRLATALDQIDLYGDEADYWSVCTAIDRFIAELRGEQP